MKSVYLLALLGLMAAPAWATHLLGGQIQVRNVSGNTYEITIVVFGDESLGSGATSVMNSIPVCLGDGSTQEAERKARAFTADRTVSINTYRFNYTYNAPGSYRITTSITNRTSATNLPQVADTPFTLSTTVQASGNFRNSTPIFDPTSSSFISLGTNQRAILNFRSADAEGDSVVYILARPLTTPTSAPCNAPNPLAQYQYPNAVSQRGTYKLNGRTGELVWDAPTTPGQYSAAIQIWEYRNGVQISESSVETILKVVDKAGTPSTIPAYEPASEVGIVLATDPEADNGLMLTVSPNPVQNQFVASLRSNKPTAVRLQLLDVAGRIVAEKTLTRPTVDHENTFTTESLPSGMYVLKADADGRILSRKIFKQ